MGFHDAPKPSQNNEKWDWDWGKIREGISDTEGRAEIERFVKAYAREASERGDVARDFERQIKAADSKATK